MTIIDLKTEEPFWRDKLNASFFPVEESEVRIGNTDIPSKKFKAIKKRHVRSDEDEPFAIVTGSYKLIRHEDAMDLGYEAFERMYGAGLLSNMTVFNVLVSTSGGSFLADLTSPELALRLNIRGLETDSQLFFLRVTNSYDRTRAVRVEAGICRWICRNGLIFGTQSIRFRDPHHKSKQSLLDYIADKTKLLKVDQVFAGIERAYHVNLVDQGSLIPSMLQTLRLSVPSPNSSFQTSNRWTRRCKTLVDIADKYKSSYGQTAFSAIQASSEWVKHLMSESPLQRDSYERRCGEMLELVQTSNEWPKSNLSGSQEDEQVQRVMEWANNSHVLLT